MIANKCLICGSSNLRADRALSGRLVCNSCGTPLGVGRGVKKRLSIHEKFSVNNRYFLFICILLIAFILVVI